MSYEYIRLSFDFGDLDDLNSLGSIGWRVVSIQKEKGISGDFIALLEREKERELWKERVHYENKAK